MNAVQEPRIPAPMGNIACVWMLRVGWLASLLGALLIQSLPLPAAVIVMGVGNALSGLSVLCWSGYWVDRYLWRTTKHFTAEAQRESLDLYASGGVRRVNRLVFITLAVVFVALGTALIVSGLRLLYET